MIDQKTLKVLLENTEKALSEEVRKEGTFYNWLMGRRDAYEFLLEISLDPYEVLADVS